MILTVVGCKHQLEAARTSHPAKQNQDRITRELLLAQRRIDRLMTAYQEDLLSLNELRRRMPELRQRETRLKAELVASQRMV